MFSSTVSTVVSLGTGGDPPPPPSYHQRSSMMGQATLSQIQTYVGTDTYPHNAWFDGRFAAVQPYLPTYIRLV